MKKIAKLSLVAAVAVAGFSTANAQPLEEAIKNVEVSGSVVYRYNDYNNSSKTTDDSTTTNNYKVAANLSSKVNEDVKFNSRFLVANENGDFAGPLSTQEAGDTNVDVELSHAYFGYTGITNTTVNVGKQGLTTPWTVAVDSDGAEQTGTGVLALSTVGPVTFAAAYFNQTNLGKSGNGLPNAFNDPKPTLYDVASEHGYDVYSKDNAVAKAEKDLFDTRRKNDDYFRLDTDGHLNDKITGWNTDNSTIANKLGSLDIATVGAIVDLKPVTLDAWYLDMQDLFDSYTVGAKADLDLAGVKLGVDTRYASLDLDDSDVDNAMAKIVLTAKAGIVNGKVAYAWTDKDGGLTALDNDASTTLQGWNLNANGKADADYWQAVVGVDVLSNLNLSANYGNLEYITSSTTDVEEEEIYAQLTYKMSKNLSTYVRYGTYEKETITSGTKVENNDDVRGRLQVEYTF